MNIHFSDKQLFNNLSEAALCRLTIGSKLYGLEHKESDTDYLYILPKTVLETNSFLNSYHQLQYKDEITHTDHNFTNIHNFITNCISGDSTVNFECLHSLELQNSELGFLAKCHLYFYNYNIIRSYLGLCDRDIKHYGKQKTMKDKASAIIHVYRGFSFAKSIFENSFQLLDNQLIELAKNVRRIYQSADNQNCNQNHKQISIPNNATYHNLQTPKYYEHQLDIMQQEIKDFRQNILNKALENKQINKTMLPEFQSILDSHLHKFIEGNFYQQQRNKITLQNQKILMGLFYHANENWVNY